MCHFKLAGNGFRLCEGADLLALTLNRSSDFKDSEKVSIGALNPLSCKTDVVGSAVFSRFVVRWLGSSFAFLLGFVRLEKCKCATKCVGYFPVKLSANNSACFNTVSIALACLSGG